MNLKKKWDIYLIHHSHTDIGYTQRQEKIMRYHYDFIRQAIDILDELHKPGNEQKEGFVWQCENYWQVENFYAMADDDEKRRFENYVRSGEIGLSGNYLNFNEVLSGTVLNKALEHMEQYGEKIGHPITAGMCADINGMSWGYAGALYEHGIRYFFSALHNHHGMFPLYQKMQPFYWETPKGNRILVWNGEHYNIGNDLFLAPHAGFSYMIQDEFTPLTQQHLILNQNENDTRETELRLAQIRISRYLENLEREGYVYDLVPLMISGVISDNAPPCAGITERIDALNQAFGGRIHIKMATLEQFFEEAEARCKDIPVYRGDWTDWWADGAGSAPASLKIYREAVRGYEICKKLDRNGRWGNQALVDRTEKNLLLYAEHTWGYSASVTEPWDSLVTLLDAKKDAYAADAHTDISRNLDQILAHKGEISIRSDKPPVYLLVNPHEEMMNSTVNLYIEHWEYLNGRIYDNAMPIAVIDCVTGKKLPCQVKRIARATQVEVSVRLRDGECRKVRIEPLPQPEKTVENRAYRGVDGVADLLENGALRQDTEVIETEAFRVSMDDSRGVYSIIDKSSGQELIRKDAEGGAFSGIYEITAHNQSPELTRKYMGRNRRTKATHQVRGRLIDRRIMEAGDIYIAAELDYALEGTRIYTLCLKVYQKLPKIEATVRIHKESRWEPENLYISLPFTAGAGSTAFVDKTGCIIRPGIDQLPGTCQDFYMVQNAVLWQDGEKNVAVIAKDAPLMSFGELRAAPIVLCDGNDWDRNRSQVYSWVMNNFWETNFRANLGGFYEFRYILMTAQNKTPEEMYRLCEEENQGLLSCYTE